MNMSDSHLQTCDENLRKEPWLSERSSMRRNMIGGTGIGVTEIGLGTAQLGDLYAPLDQNQAQAIVDASWEGGIRYFDTAPHYGLGLAEERLGIALRSRPRDTFVVSTKVGRLVVGRGGVAHRVWDFSAQGVARSIAASRRRLRLDHLDIAFIHDPEDHVEEALASSVPELVRMRAAGDISAIGVASKDVQSLLRFVHESDIDVIMLAGRLTLLDHSALDELIPACMVRGVSVVGAAVFNSGILAHERPDQNARFNYDASPAHLVERARELAALATRHGYTLPEAAVAFASEPSPPVASVVLGADSKEQAKRNVALLRVTADREKLRSAVLSR